MASDTPPLNFRIRVEGLESFDEAIEISYKIDSNFYLNDIASRVIKEYWKKFKGCTIVCSEINLIGTNPELLIIEDENHEPGIITIENEPFIADSDNLTVSWESDRYVMKNQGVKVIELFQNKKYVMIIKKRSKNHFIILFSFYHFHF